MMTITGNIYSVGELKTYQNFNKRELVIMNAQQEPIKVTISGNDTSLIDAFPAGGAITVTAHPSGRFWTNKDGVKIVISELIAKISSNAPSVSPNPLPVASNEIPATPINIDTKLDNPLPF